MSTTAAVNNVNHVPGLKAGHQIITDECREIRGDEGAREAAVEAINRRVQNLMGSWASGERAKIHIAVYVEYPK